MCAVAWVSTGHTAATHARRMLFARSVWFRVVSFRVRRDERATRSRVGTPSPADPRAVPLVGANETVPTRGSRLARAPRRLSPRRDSSTAAPSPARARMSATATPPSHPSRLRASLRPGRAVSPRVDDHPTPLSLENHPWILRARVRLRRRRRARRHPRPLRGRRRCRRRPRLSHRQGGGGKQRVRDFSVESHGVARRVLNRLEPTSTSRKTGWRFPSPRRPPSCRDIARFVERRSRRRGVGGSRREAPGVEMGAGLRRGSSKDEPTRRRRCFRKRTTRSSARKTTDARRRYSSPRTDTSPRARDGDATNQTPRRRRRAGGPAGPRRELVTQEGLSSGRGGGGRRGELGGWRASKEAGSGRSAPVFRSVFRHVGEGAFGAGEGEGPFAREWSEDGAGGWLELDDAERRRESAPAEEEEDGDRQLA